MSAAKLDERAEVLGLRCQLCFSSDVTADTGQNTFTFNDHMKLTTFKNKFFSSLLACK